MISREMALLLVFLLALYQLQSTVNSEVSNSPKFSSISDSDDDLNALIPPDSTQDLFSTEQHENDIDEETFGPTLSDNVTNEDVALVKSGHEQAEMIFRHPIASVNIDYSKNMILLKFRKDRLKQRMRMDPEQEERRRQLEQNFMRFGRSPSSQDFMRFGRSSNSQDFMRFGRSPNSQDFMRFGRSPNSQDFMRFGRSPSSQDFMRFGRSPTSQDFMRFGRSPTSQDFMRFGRSPTSQDFMRFGRSPTSQDFMRFGRSPASQDFMRFGKRQLEELPSMNSVEEDFFYKDPNGRYERSSEVMRDSRGDNFMRFGRSSQDFMRFGRNPSDFMRFGRSPEDFMRLGRNPADFMRFGRSDDDFMRLGRSKADDYMRFGRTPEDFMRFGRSSDDSKHFGNGGQSNDFMRFGRSSGDFMRFGRNSNNMPPETDRNFMRFGRPDNFMRFGRSTAEPTDKSPNFMRFGKSDKNSTEIQEQKNKVKQMMLADHEKDSGESNPMDKAIKVLYNNKQKESAELDAKSHEAEAAADTDYVLNMLDK